MTKVQHAERIAGIKIVIVRRPISIEVGSAKTLTQSCILGQVDERPPTPASSQVIFYKSHSPLLSAGAFTCSR